MSRKILIDDDAAQYASVEQRLKRLEQGIPEDTHAVGSTGEPAFENSWVNYDTTTWPAAGFYKAGGRVWLQGMVNRGASALTLSTVFTLPDGYRPAKRSLLTATATGALARVDVYSDGQVQLVSGTVGTGGSSSYLSLEGISFRHA